MVAKRYLKFFLELNCQVTDAKTGKLTAILTQYEVEPDMQSFMIKCKYILYDDLVL